MAKNRIRPNVLVLASDVLFQHFFSDDSLAKLDEVTSWTRSALREDSPELRSQIANADVLMTTWHSPFLTAEMLGQHPRVKLIAHCGGEVKSRVAEEIFDIRDYYERCRSDGARRRGDGACLGVDSRPANSRVRSEKCARA